MARKKPDAQAVKAAYAGLAEDYERRWAFYVCETARATLARLDPGEEGRLLDVGCGTGLLLHEIGTRHPRLELHGADLTASMLAVARRRLEGRASLVVADACELPYEDGAFTTVISASALHYMREPERCVEEMVRLLAPGGELVVTDWCDDYLACKLCDLWLRLADPSHFRTLGTRACGDLLAHARLAGTRVERYRISWLWGLMTGRGRRPRTAPARPERGEGPSPPAETEPFAEPA